MTEENQKDFLSSQTNILKIYLAVRRHDVYDVIILNQSDLCFHSSRWIHRPNYLE